MAISSNISYDSKTETSVTLHGYYSSGGTQAVRTKFYCDGSYFADDTSSGSTDWVTDKVTKTGLSADTSYTFTVHFYDSNGTSLTNSSTTVRTDTPPAPDSPTWISAYATSSTDVYLDWSSVSGADKYEVQYLKDGVTQYKTVYNSSTYVGGLDPATSYTFYVLTYDGYSWSERSSGKTVTTDSGRPTNFSWDTPKISGDAVTNLTAAEWSDFQNKINEFRSYEGLDQFSFYSYHNGDWSFTNAVSGNIFYYYHFNQARNAINQMNYTTTLPNSVNSGDKVYASDLNGLVDALNSIL